MAEALVAFLAFAPRAAMRSADPEGDAVPVASSDREKKVPDARGRQR